MASPNSSLLLNKRPPSIFSFLLLHLPLSSLYSTSNPTHPPINQWDGKSRRADEEETTRGDCLVFLALSVQINKSNPLITPHHPALFSIITTACSSSHIKLLSHPTLAFIECYYRSLLCHRDHRKNTEEGNHAGPPPPRKLDQRPHTPTKGSRKRISLLVACD